MFNLFTVFQTLFIIRVIQRIYFYLLSSHLYTNPILFDEQEIEINIPDEDLDQDNDDAKSKYGLKLQQDQLKIWMKSFIGFIFNPRQRFLSLFGERCSINHDNNLNIPLYHDSIPTIRHTLTSRDGITLSYDQIGTGSKIIYLCNGVGTGLYLWFPLLYALEKLYIGTFFKEYTLIAPSYRGLYSSNSDKPLKNKSGHIIEAKHSDCIEDITDILKHAGINKIKCIIGWSMGAQIALAYTSKYPNMIERLYLLNPSTGKTLTGALQPIVPLPSQIGNIISTCFHVN